MKATILLLLSCLCLRAADDIHVATVVSTNGEAGTMTTQEFFTRAGQTNLVCSTTTRDGVVRSRAYRFYHNGRHAADHLTVPAVGDSLVDTYNGFDIAMVSRSNALQEVTLRDQYDRVVDRFVSTNGVFRPVPTSELRGYINNRPAGEFGAEKQGAK